MWAWLKIFSLLQSNPRPRPRPRPILIIRWFKNKIKDFAICSMVLMKRRRLVIGHGLTSSNNITIIISSIDILSKNNIIIFNIILILIIIIKRKFRIFFYWVFWNYLALFKLIWIGLFCFFSPFGFVEIWCIGDTQRYFLVTSIEWIKFSFISTIYIPVYNKTVH